MIISQALPSDHIDLSNITKKSKAYWNYSPEQILLWDQELTITSQYISANHVFNGVSDDMIIGYYSYFPIEKYIVKLDNLFVLPDYIGRGIGGELLQDFTGRVSSQDYKKITLDADPNAECFYDYHGFVRIGEIATSIKNRVMPVMEKLILL